MTIIDGINVAVHNCDECGKAKMLIFRGQDGEGYKIACANCHKDQRDLITELKLPYLWRHKEAHLMNSNKKVRE